MENFKKSILKNTFSVAGSVGAPVWSISTTRNCDKIPGFTALMLDKEFLVLNDSVSKLHIQFCGLFDLVPFLLHAEISLCHKVWSRLTGQESDARHPSEFRGVF